MTRLFWKKLLRNKILTKSVFVREFQCGKKGFFLLYAILLTSIILIIGLGVFEITLKQVSFSGIDRESVRAFYAADAGLECALYQDVVLNKFSTSTPPGTIVCNGQTIPVSTQINPPQFTFIFWLNKSIPKDQSSAGVVLSRTIASDGTVATTTISSLGYNTSASSPTRYPVVERGLRSAY
jgi:hypothetical protein